MESAPAGNDPVPYRQVRAVFDESTIVVYQAYPPEIAEPALAAGTFVPPFGMSRMTWIKPSFLWMAYRSGWASKPGQTSVLRIRIKRSGFEWALANSCLSHFDRKQHTSEAAWSAQVRKTPVRVQWDPEQTIHMQPQQKIRSLQIGLSGEAVELYVNDWITSIEDATTEMRHVRDVVKTDPRAATDLLPAEIPYPLPNDVAQHIAASPFD
jgi:Domain of unknown function (DUF4291)